MSSDSDNIYCRNGIWQVRFTVGGRERRGTLRTRDEAVARKRAKALKDKTVARHHFGDDRKTYVEVFAAWSDEIVTQVGAKTAQRYGVSLGQLEPWLKPLFFDEMDRPLVSTIVKARRLAGVKNATIKRDLTALSSVFEFGIAEGWRDEDDNPALAKQRRVKERRDPIVLPDHKDIAFVVSRAPGCLADMARVALLTGCRQNELATAQSRALDRDRRQLTVRGKGNKTRVLELSDAAYEAIRKIPAKLGCRWLFWHDDGEPYRNVSSRFAYIVKSAHESAQKTGAEFRSFTFHHLRHRFAVDYLKSGGNIYDLQQHLGHASVKTTEDYLKFLTPEEARAAKLSTSQKTAHIQRSGAQ